MASVKRKRLRIVVGCAFDAGETRAFAINTIKIANGFASLGHQVSIVCYNGKDRRYTSDELANLYNVSPTIRWIQLPRIRNGQLAMNEHRPFAALALPITLLLRPDIVYARNYVFPAWTARVGLSTVVESHAHVDFSTAPFLTMIRATRFPQMKKLVTIAPALKDYYIKRGFDADKIQILPTGVNIEDFLPPQIMPPSPYEQQGFHAVYAGHLYDYKGIPSILDAAQNLPTVNFHLVGGLDEDIQRQKAIIAKRSLQNITLHGYQLQEDVPPYLWYADVLLLPPSAKHPSAEWTSPVKLGEYLASGSRIIATDIPALRNWISEKEVDFCVPDDGNALADAIQNVMQSSDTKFQNRRNLAQQMSIKKRAEKILEQL